MREIALVRGETGLHCMAGGVGFEMRANEIYSWDGLQRGGAPFALIQHTVSGTGRLDFGGVLHKPGPGETMLLTFPHAHRYWLASGESWEYFWAILKGREALRLAGSILSVTGPILRPSKSGVDRLAGACLDLLEGSSDTPGAVSSAAYTMLMTLYDTALGSSREEVSLPPAVQRAVGFIESNPARAIDVGLLARIAGQSRAHFVRTFTKATRATPSAFVLAARMNRAERLLLATDLPVRDIAPACGFPDPNYFAKAFRRLYGQSPGAFRNARRRVGFNNPGQLDPGEVRAVSPHGDQRE
ncbi:helix-turn-helix domain-containing protein [Pelagibacterium limicola]|uniref:helix-turn-helix domain-containing protein n=1 Tax=Pelagibacterium limicola TaxID=2791022 RepID=UPI0018AFF92C|nr:AraC family transcriptional regulator [Pelagibacterium limicola]